MWQVLAMSLWWESGEGHDSNLSCTVSGGGSIAMLGGHRWSCWGEGYRQASIGMPLVHYWGCMDMR